MTKKERANGCVAALKKEYPDAICSLDYTDPLQLLIATRLSAQCTDARVNLVTPALFEAYPDLDAFCEAKVEDVERYIHSCGFFRAKAKDIVGMAQKIRNDFGGEVPDTVEALTTLPGVGRKTANLIVGDVYHKPALRGLLDPDESNDFCHRCVLHGRAVCVARRPQCGDCCLRPYCKSAPKAG